MNKNRENGIDTERTESICGDINFMNNKKAEHDISLSNKRINTDTELILFDKEKHNINVQPISSTTTTDRIINRDCAFQGSNPVSVEISENCKRATTNVDSKRKNKYNLEDVIFEEVFKIFSREELKEMIPQDMKEKKGCKRGKFLMKEISNLIKTFVVMNDYGKDECQAMEEEIEKRIYKEIYPTSSLTDVDNESDQIVNSKVCKIEEKYISNIPSFAGSVRQQNSFMSNQKNDSQVYNSRRPPNTPENHTSRTKVSACEMLFNSFDSKDFNKLNQNELTETTNILHNKKDTSSISDNNLIADLVSQIPSVRNKIEKETPRYVDENKNILDQ